MKLNHQKCVFGVESGKFLGFMVNHRGIDANPAKIEALIYMKSLGLLVLGPDTIVEGGVEYNRHKIIAAE